MLKSSYLYSFFLSFLPLLISVNGDCIINVQNESPLFIKSLGNKELRFQKESGIIKLLPGETIDAHCASGINFRQSNYNPQVPGVTSSMSIQCDWNSLVTYKSSESKTYTSNSGSREAYIQCENSVNNLYVSNVSLPNCEEYLTYAIGTSITYKKDSILIGLCYDLEALKIKYAAYSAYLPKYENIDRTKLSNVLPVELTDKVSNLDSYFKFISAASFNKSVDEKKKSNELLRLHEFDYASLIQDRPLSKELKQFENLINIIWWRNLRLGSWKFYLDVLEELTKTEKYLIYTGTSGVVTMPSQFCHDNEMLVFNKDLKMPKYIWSYLVSNKTEKFVIIGVNSPFYHIHDSKHLCKDMCNEIGWLKNSIFGRIRLIPTVGVVICCRPEEVWDKLDHFPQNVVKISEIQSNAVTETITELYPN